jgi:hypothetical protein
MPRDKKPQKDNGKKPGHKQTMTSQHNMARMQSFVNLPNIEITANRKMDNASKFSEALKKDVGRAKKTMKNKYVSIKYREVENAKKLTTDRLEKEANDTKVDVRKSEKEHFYHLGARSRFGDGDGSFWDRYVSI